MAIFTPSSSPAITVREIDLTGVTPNVQSSTGAIVGDYKWGPIEKPVLVDNESTLAATFGAPSSTTAVDFLSAAQFLKYSGNLYVTRVATSAAYNANANDDSAGYTALIKNDDEYESVKTSFGVDSGEMDVGMWIAKYAGALGNSLRVSFCPQPGDFDTWAYKSAFDSAPGTSAWATSQNGASNDEVHVVVVDRLGVFGTAGAVLEAFAFLSVASGAKTSDGSSNYITDVINSRSRFINFGYIDTVRLPAGTNWGIAPSQGTPTDYSAGISWTDGTSSVNLVSGADSGSITSTEMLLGFDQYEDVDTIEVDFLIAPGASSDTDQTAVVNDLVATAGGLRKDCVVVTSPDRAAVVNNSTPVASTITTTDTFTASSYLIVDNNYLKVYDKYNDQYIYIPAASSTAGVMAASDLLQGPWFSPAGQKRGQYLGVTSLAYSATKTERDTLYKAGVNPIVNLPGQGVLLYGDKTKESRPSAFDRINVRRLFLSVEKAIALAARNVMFEFNDEFTRAEFVNIIEPFLREIKGRRGITDFVVQCDETNNTPAVIDRNELIASIFIKPARSINYITLNFVAVRTGVDFEEVVGTV
jgi:phage tail sheath protein FI